MPISVAPYARFAVGYVWAALLLALSSGFAIGAHLAAVVGFGFPPGRGFYSFVQTHGHVQLLGWAGLLIVGISLHFIPRLAGTPLQRPQWIPRILSAIAGGLALRSVAQPLLPYLEGSAYGLLGLLVAVSAVSEALGIATYLALLLETMRASTRSTERQGLVMVRPFFDMMIAGWAVYIALNTVLAVKLAVTGATLLDQRWNQFAIQAFTGLVLLPVPFAFSVRMLPLYLRLPYPDWPVRAIAAVYLGALVVQLVPMLPPLVDTGPSFLRYLSVVGQTVKGVTVLWFVWELDLLTRRRQPWTVRRKLHPGSERRPTRDGLPDYGEFGRFERLVYAAYIWLVAAAALEVLSGVAALLGDPAILNPDALRHLYLLGFVTHLILGMAVRMIPGLIQRRRVASAALVDATFWLGNGAVICRVLPLLVPVSLSAQLPALHRALQAGFGISGLLGMLAVGCLAVNLWRTVREPPFTVRLPFKHLS